jgi:hypothetical protein
LQSPSLLAADESQRWIDEFRPAIRVVVGEVRAGGGEFDSILAVDVTQQVCGARTVGVSRRAGGTGAQTGDSLAGCLLLSAGLLL